MVFYVIKSDLFMFIFVSQVLNKNHKYGHHRLFTIWIKEEVNYFFYPAQVLFEQSSWINWINMLYMYFVWVNYKIL